MYSPSYYYLVCGIFKSVEGIVLKPIWLYCNHFSCKSYGWYISYPREFTCLLMFSYLLIGVTFLLSVNCLSGGYRDYFQRCSSFTPRGGEGSLCMQYTCCF
jgi:hypothetical protein